MESKYLIPEIVDCCAVGQSSDYDPLLSIVTEADIVYALVNDYLLSVIIALNGLPH